MKRKKEMKINYKVKERKKENWLWRKKERKKKRKKEMKSNYEEKERKKWKLIIK